MIGDRLHTPEWQSVVTDSRVSVLLRLGRIGVSLPALRSFGVGLMQSRLSSSRRKSSPGFLVQRGPLKVTAWLVSIEAYFARYTHTPLTARYNWLLNLFLIVRTGHHPPITGGLLSGCFQSDRRV